MNEDKEELINDESKALETIKRRKKELNRN